MQPWLGWGRMGLHFLFFSCGLWSLMALVKKNVLFFQVAACLVLWQTEQISTRTFLNCACWHFQGFFSSNSGIYEVRRKPWNSHQKTHYSFPEVLSFLANQPPLHLSESSKVALHIRSWILVVLSRKKRESTSSPSYNYQAKILIFWKYFYSPYMLFV